MRLSEELYDGVQRSSYARIVADRPNTATGEIDAVEMYPGPIEAVYRVEFSTTGDLDRDDELRTIVLEVGRSRRARSARCAGYRVGAHVYDIDNSPHYRVFFVHPA